MKILLQNFTGCDNLFTGCSCRRGKVKFTNEREIEMKKRANFKNVKGITLIALVITIVLNCYRSGRKLEYAM